MTESQSATEVLPQDLREMTSSLHALTLCRSFVLEPEKPRTNHDRVSTSIFLTSLFVQMLKNLLAHPDFDKYPSLKPFKELANEYAKAENARTSDHAIDSGDRGESASPSADVTG